ncbi:MAG: HAMP domain-containing histidine kinase [Williamsia sp.]|nr:HAMP domain-containing histidine kinase [Williamsia sp.]
MKRPYFVSRINIYLLSVAILVFLASRVVSYLWTHVDTFDHLHHSIERSIQSKEEDFSKTLQDTALLRRITDQAYDEAGLKRLVAKQYGLFIYQSDQYGLIKLAFWNNQGVLPSPDILFSHAANGFATLPSGQFEFIRRELSLSDNRKILAIGLVPVYSKYFMQISHLREDFVGHYGAGERVFISRDSSGKAVKSLYKNTLFYLKAKPFKPASNWVSTLLGTISVILLLIAINNTAILIARKQGALKGILFLVATILLLRSATYLFADLLNLKQYGLFRPGIYGAGYILSSLGDLLINSLLACWLVIFIRQVTVLRHLNTRRTNASRWAITLLLVIVLVVITFGAADIVKSLIADGRIPFSVTNFFNLNIYSVLSFFILACISVTYFYAAELLLKSVIILLQVKQVRRGYLYMLIAATGLLLLTFQKGYEVFELNGCALIWLLIYTWLIQKRAIAGLFNRLNVSAVVFWLFIYAFSVSLIILSENQRIELEQRKRMAEKLSSQTSPSSELLISIAFAYFGNDAMFPDFNRFKTASSNRFLKDSLTNRNFIVYLTKFDTKIYTFDAQERPLFNDESLSFDTLNTVYQIDGIPTSINDVRYYEKSYDKYAYIFKKTVLDSAGQKAGYLFVMSNPKQYKNDALIPELFRQNRELFPEFSPDYSYAVYNDLRLYDHYNNYEFPTHLKAEEVPQNRSIQKKAGYNLLWYNEGENKIVIFVKKDNTLLESVTLFAYLFSTFIMLAILYRFFALLIHSKWKWRNFRQYWQLNIRSQIYITIIFISLFSFLVIGLATVIFFYNRYEKNNKERLSKAIQIMVNDIQNKIRGQGAFTEMINAYNAGSDNQLENLLNDVAEIHGTEVNLYDLDGNLKMASNPFIYSKGILSSKMNPVAFYFIHNEQLVEFMNEERMGDVPYKSIYSPIRDTEGNTYAYLNIPSFVSQAELKKEISNFLVTIINLNAFIFLLAGVVALFITHRITSSFLLIGHKMREINLGKLNEEIAWHRDDEIGGLIKEYNKMVVKLEESAQALAKSEREGAWREMARQVAHEIKNPLTPMKLSIQYLQKAINNNSGNVKELSANVANTLIEQIDHLSKIAADFSQFANIGNVRTEVFDLHEILHSLGLLYESVDSVQFKWFPVHQSVFIEADKTQVNRLFTNLFQNAVEACNNKELCLLSVTEELSDDAIVIRVSDNGDGIPEAMRKKIFMPNFTTKSSGTGLGLAMSKTITEQIRGRIWFETEEGTGTTFLVEIPIAEPIL